MANHASHVAHHFDSSKQQFESSKLGMWLFLATEILLFSGLFVAYAVYRVNHPEIFEYAHQFLDKKLGGINTLVLIFSSFTMAWAVRAVQLGKQKKAVTLLVITLICAFGFLGIKYVEYEHKWKHGLLPGTHYNPEHVVTGTDHAELPAPVASHDGSASSLIAPAAEAPAGLAAPVETAADHGAAHGPSGESPKNVHIFFGIYFAMTGLHGLHVIAGMVVITWMIIRTRRGDFGPDYYTPVDLTGLYWHLVDMIWIYLFPLLYLIR